MYMHNTATTVTHDNNVTQQVHQTVIDVDVHEMLKSTRDLVPYLAEPWRSNITERGWQMERRLPYVQMSVAGLDRADAKPRDGGPGGSDYELMREQVLDRYNVSHVVLTGLFYTSTMHGWYEFASALSSAYNDWLIDRWLSRDSRLKGSVHVAAQDPKTAAREIDRVGSHPQMVQVMLPLTDHLLYGDPYFDPIYEAAQRNNLVVAMHQSGATTTTHGYMRYFIEWHTGICQAWMTQLISLIGSGVFSRFKDLRVAMIEGGFTWVPHLMSRFDQQYRQLRVEVPWVEKFPSQYIRDHVRFSTQPMEQMTAKQFLDVIDWMGSDELLMFSSDYPHWDFDSPEECFPSGIPETLRRKILFENAAAFYGF